MNTVKKRTCVQNTINISQKCSRTYLNSDNINYFIFVVRLYFHRYKTTHPMLQMRFSALKLILIINNACVNISLRNHIIPTVENLR